MDCLPDDGARRINFSWLLRLRWGALGGQAATILFVDRYMQIPLPLGPLLALVAVGVASNVACLWWMGRRRPVHEAMLGGVMALDVLLLTGLLYFTGGPFNPFSFLYLVHISLATIVLSPRWAWALVALSLLGSAALFVEHVWIVGDPHKSSGPHARHMLMHLRGMWVALGIAAVFIVHFLGRVTRDLARRDVELASARAAAQRSERLASLATFAAGAAHELSTPLSTIAVVAKELERALEQASGAPGTVDDARLIRQEVDRCRDILHQLAVDLGEGPAEGFAEVRAREILDLAVSTLTSQAVDVSGGDEVVLRAPPRVLAQAVRALAKNAQEAYPDGRIEISASRDSRRCRVRILDRGTGMKPDVLARAGEPFFTTKPPGSGMGLGLFLARAVVERLGGELTLESTFGSGTVVDLLLPLQAIPGSGEAEA